MTSVGILFVLRGQYTYVTHEYSCFDNVGSVINDSRSSRVKSCSEAVTEVTMMSGLWDVTPCGLVEVHCCFGGSNCQHFSGCLRSSLFDHEDGSSSYLRNISDLRDYAESLPS